MTTTVVLLTKKEAAYLKIKKTYDDQTCKVNGQKHFSYKLTKKQLDKIIKSSGREKGKIVDSKKYGRRRAFPETESASEEVGRVTGALETMGSSENSKRIQDELAEADTYIHYLWRSTNPAQQKALFQEWAEKTLHLDYIQSAIEGEAFAFRELGASYVKPSLSPNTFTKKEKGQIRIAIRGLKEDRKQRFRGHYSDFKKMADKMNKYEKAIMDNMAEHTKLWDEGQIMDDVKKLSPDDKFEMMDTLTRTLEGLDKEKKSLLAKTDKVKDDMQKKAREIAKEETKHNKKAMSLVSDQLAQKIKKRDEMMGAVETVKKRAGLPKEIDFGRYFQKLV